MTKCSRSGHFVLLLMRNDLSRWLMDLDFRVSFSLGGGHHFPPCCSRWKDEGSAMVPASVNFSLIFGMGHFQSIFGMTSVFSLHFKMKHNWKDILMGLNHMKWKDRMPPAYIRSEFFLYDIQRRPFWKFCSSCVAQKLFLILPKGWRIRGSHLCVIHQFLTFVVRSINQRDVLAAYFSQGLNLCDW